MRRLAAGGVLRGLGDGRFAPLDMAESGVAIDGEVRDMKYVRQARGGRLDVRSAPGTGTFIRARLPMAPPPIWRPAYPRGDLAPRAGDAHGVAGA